MLRLDCNNSVLLSQLKLVEQVVTNTKMAWAIVFRDPSTWLGAVDSDEFGNRIEAYGKLTVKQLALLISKI